MRDRSDRHCVCPRPLVLKRVHRPVRLAGDYAELENIKSERPRTRGKGDPMPVRAARRCPEATAPNIGASGPTIATDRRSSPSLLGDKAGHLWRTKTLGGHRARAVRTAGW